MIENDKFQLFIDVHFNCNQQSIEPLVHNNIMQTERESTTETDN